MARDRSLEALLNDELDGRAGLTQKAMFGGWAWLLHGNLLCAAREGGMLVRLGKDNDGWALAMKGVAPMILRGRVMNGWVRAAPEVYANDATRQRLVHAALEFVRTLPAKV
jgi:TfoX N-terminal domain